MKKIFLLLLMAWVPAMAFTEERPISNHYRCLDKGCSLACLNIKNKWSTLASGAKSVDLSHYASGNVEYRLKYGQAGGNAQGDEVLVISKFHLQCKLTGVVD